MPPRSPFPMFGSGSDSRTALLQGLMIGAIVIGGLYIGREVLLPLALAILLSFVLTPLLLLLRKVKVPRVPAVIEDDVLIKLTQIHHRKNISRAASSASASRSISLSSL